MKNISSPRIVTLILTGILLTNFNFKSQNILADNYSTHKVLKIISPVSETATAQKETHSAFQKFVREANAKLDANETAILKLTPDVKGKNDRQIGTNTSDIGGLKAGNRLMRDRLEEYVQNGTGNWQSFESEFYHDLNEFEVHSDNTMIKSNDNISTTIK